MRATALSQPLISKLTLRPLASMVTPVRPSISVEIISDTVWWVGAAVGARKQGGVT